MKESWTYYDHVRRWWRFFILGLCLGALAGFGFYIQQDHKVEFGFVVTIDLKMLEESQIIGDTIAPGIINLQIIGDRFSSEKEAVEQKELAVAQMQAATVWGEAAFQRAPVEGERQDASLWKAIVLGGVIGGLLSVGFVYVWSDILQYRRHRRKFEVGEADIPDVNDT